MAQTFVTLAVILAISATTQSKPAEAWLGGGSGSSHKTAIVVHASSAVIGQPAQYAYIQAHYPGYRFIGHAFSFKDGKSYEIMTFADAHGKKHALIFDISEYFKPTTSTHLTNRSS